MTNTITKNFVILKPINGLISLDKTEKQMLTHTTDIVISGEALSIADDCFAGLTALKSIYIPNSVKSIGDHAFEGCLSLETVEIPDGLRYLGRACFRDCLSLREVYLPRTLRHIGDFAFQRTGLVSVQGEGLYRTNETTFEGSYALKSFGEDSYIGCLRRPRRKVTIYF